MTTLQTATEYAVLVYCCVMIIAFIALAIATLMVRRKINKVKQNVKQKIDILTNMPYIGKKVVEAIKKNLK